MLGSRFSPDSFAIKARDTLLTAAIGGVAYGVQENMGTWSKDNITRENIRYLWQRAWTWYNKNKGISKTTRPTPFVFIPAGIDPISGSILSSMFNVINSVNRH
ncbi:hypothetical protein [Candidatus Babela massiliensis]|uniref:Uncharacterized protein n=1 Tax=Candidatus Babela massiliensis TaxID=673862 RepID=V6DIV3_9BACT|nr:hypothetical protein [Candidatus Babela massiliensis]CDK30461.1 hypothetical protein BABL1_gene_557 [Candidatus Babela massiliensis]